MIESPIAIQTRCLGLPIKKALHTAARLECDGVQFDARQELCPTDLSETGIRQIRKMLDDLSLRVSSVAFPTEHGFSNPDGLERRMEGAIGAMRMASRLRSDIILLNLGTLPESVESTALADTMGVLGSQALHFGLQLALHAPGADPAALADWLEHMPEGVLGVDLSPAAIISQGKSPTEFAAALGPRIVHVHANDAVRDMAVHQGAGNRAVEVELGRGSADFPSLLGQLQEHHYRGWMTIERYHTRNVVEETANAVIYLRTCSV